MQDGHVPLQGQPNFRDLGGYRTADGRTVKRGLVYRSGELNNLTARDLDTLGPLGLEMVVDLRSPLEVEARGADRLPTGARGLALPIDPGDLGAALRGLFEEADLSMVPADFLATASRMIVRDATRQYATLLDALADPASLPLVFHCTHGKDRAGIAAAVILLALGVPVETARADYLLSNTYRKQENDEQLLRIREGTARRQGIPAKDVDLANVEALFFLDPSYFDAALDEMVREHGSVEQYLRDGMGLADTRRDALRTGLLE